MAATSLPGDSARIRSLDVLRGAVMVLMVIDHVRVFAGVPAGGPDPAIFFTRWVTHFCAPVFVFFAGTSASLYGRTHQDLPRFLFTRGLWLIFLELTFIRLAWTFNFEFGTFALAGVIWVIGWSMIVLAALCRLPLPLIGVFGGLLVAGHNLLDGHLGPVYENIGSDRLGWLWKILYLGFSAGPIEFAGKGSSFWVIYSLVPWVGLMALGYFFGRRYAMPEAERHRGFVRLGLVFIAAFLILRWLGAYGDPRSWAESAQYLPSALAFLNPSKYPASIQFLLMTLGPAIALLPLADKARGPIGRALELFGRVPFFFYLLHIPLVHLLAIGVSLVRQGRIDDWLFVNHPMDYPPPPEGYTWSLPLLYLVWAIAIVILFVACRAFADLKARRREPWLRYL